MSNLYTSIQKLHTKIIVCLRFHVQKLHKVKCCSKKIRILHNSNVARNLLYIRLSKKLLKETVMLNRIGNFYDHRC